LKRLYRIREKIQGMTAGEIAGDALLRAHRRIARAISRASDSPQTTYVSDESLRRSLDGKSITAVALRIRESQEPRILHGLADVCSTVASLKQLFPDSIERSRLEADALCDHKITLFNRVFDLGPRIDWHRDPRSLARWPLVHFTRVPLVLKEGADVRVVWELNRLHHLVTLGRSYLLTKDERYTEEFLLQLESWHEDNPPHFGTNWTVAMEVGIRAVNIVAALEMFRASPQVTDEVIALILKILIEHGRFIFNNLEFSNRVASNHYLSNLIGLFVIGMTMPEIRESRHWARYSTRGLLKEMDRQVLADGVDYEGAIGYHRLVLEIFALFFSISHANGIAIPTRRRERLKAMFDFVRNYLKPDGTAPTIGDSDDGRLFKFKTRPADDHLYLMSIAAILFESGTFKQSPSIDEEAVWWCGSDGLKAFDRLSINEDPPVSRAFSEAQIFIQRADAQQHAGGPLYAVIDCGDHGARGHGSHAHSDALSIELFAFNRTFLRNPGTYVYTGSEEQRNLFRSTAYHNTVRVDGEEISPVNEGELFAFAANVRPKVNLWESTPERDVLDAEHYAYQRLASPVTHRRIVTLDKQEGYWIIRDRFTGEGRHRFEFFFNFDAWLEVKIVEDRSVVASDEKAAVVLVGTSGHTFETELTERWISPAYGTRVQSSGVVFRKSVEVPFENSWLLIPCRLGDQQKVKRIRNSL
jgi:hypothetical protein